MDCQCHYRHFLEAFLDLARRFDAGFIRQTDVHQDHIGFHLRRNFQRLCRGACLADDFYIVLGIEQHLQARTHDRVIIHQ